MLRHVAVVVAVLVLAGPALAQPSPEFTKEFQAGVDAYRLGKFDDARTHLERARDLDPKLPGPYRFLAALAQAQGRWSDCLANAVDALHTNPLSSEAPETRKLHESCRVASGKPPYKGADLGDNAAISITTNEPGATVKINGLVYGATPLAPRPIGAAGTVEILITKQGFMPQSVHAVVEAGIVDDIHVDLEVDPKAQAAQLAEETRPAPTVGWVVVHAPDARVAIDGRDVPPTARTEVAPGTHTVEVQGRTSDPWRRRIRITAGQKIDVTPVLSDRDEREGHERAGFLFLGAGGALLAAGFATALVSEHAAADARDILRVETARDPTQPLSVTGAIEPVRTRADFLAARDRAATFGVVSDIAYGAGLVTAAVGAYYLYRGARERSDAPPPFAIVPARGGVFLAKELTW